MIFKPTIEDFIIYLCYKIIRIKSYFLELKSNKFVCK